jgi:glucokinase
MSSGPFFLGVDLGGTRMRLGAVAPDGGLASEVLSTTTGKGFGPADLERELRDLGQRVRTSLRGHDVAALGLGTAGVVLEGPLTQCDNLPLLNGVDVGALVRGVAGCPVALENDARCFTLAEARYGAARGESHVCGITLGTGVGCGLMVDGRLHRGAQSQAGEVWAIPVRGQNLEHFVSGAGVVRGYEAAGGEGREGLEAAELAMRAQAGDPAALAAWRGFGEDLAFLCECVVALVDPAIIVLGGSLAGASELYRPILASRLSGRAVRITLSELGPAAGVIGAAALNIT